MEKIELTFKCPINLNELEGSGKHKFCGQCSKSVTDFSLTPKESVSCSDKVDEPCGIFYDNQLQNPYGDFRDKLIHFYQKSKVRQNKKKIKFSMLVYLSSILLFLASCGNRKMAGAYAYGYYDDNNSNKQEVDSSNHKITEESSTLDTEKSTDQLISFE